MTIRILLFASLARETGTRQLDLEVPDGATVEQAVTIVSERLPAVAAMRSRVALAVDMAYVKPGHVLKPADELALIPPVSGG